MPATMPKVTGPGVHAWLMDMGWDAESLRSKYPTKYTYNPRAQEQFKLIVRDYARMENDKDERQYGSLLDSLARLDAGKRVEPRWGEMMKILVHSLELGEYNAMCGSAVLYETTRSPELRNGYLNQVEDEVRHVNQTHYLAKYFASQYYDPAGFTDMRKTRYVNPLFFGDRQAFGENFVAGDPVFVSLNLQLVAEACFTNPLIVAMTEWAAANGERSCAANGRRGSTVSPRSMKRSLPSSTGGSGTGATRSRTRTSCGSRRALRRRSRCCASTR